MRLLLGAGTPRGLLAGASAYLLALTTANGAVFVILITATDSEAALLAVSCKPDPNG